MSELCLLSGAELRLPFGAGTEQLCGASDLRLAFGAGIDELNGLIEVRLPFGAADRSIQWIYRFSVALWRWE